MSGKPKRGARRVSKKQALREWARGKRAHSVLDEAWLAAVDRDTPWRPRADLPADEA